MGRSDPHETLIRADCVSKLFAVRKGLIEIISSRQTRYIHAVNGVDLQIGLGENFGLMGESGSGKTTTALMIAGVERPTEGRVFLDGVDIWRLKSSELKAMRKRVQMIWQDPYDSLDPRLDVYHTLEEPLIIHGIGETKEKRLDIVSKALQSVDMAPSEYIGRRPFELSGGQRQRVCIARALTTKPEFLILDEPVSMLDMSVRAGILDLLLELRKREGLTYLFISHDLAVMRYMTDRMSVMYLGMIVESGATEGIIENPMHPYTQALFSAVPDPRVKRQRAPVIGESPDLTDLPKGCNFHARCPRRMEICRTVGPRLFSATKTHVVACHLYH